LPITPLTQTEVAPERKTKLKDHGGEFFYQTGAVPR
jgi:hypothetical protein